MSLVERKEITIAEAKVLLDVKADELDPLQRRVLDYTMRFSKVSAEDAPKLVAELVEKGEIDRPLAVQLANCMPESIPEIRTFLGRQKIISEDAVKGILMIINKYRTSA